MVVAAVMAVVVAASAAAAAASAAVAVAANTFATVQCDRRRHSAPFDTHGRREIVG